MVEENGAIRTLSIDIGGSGVKVMVLDRQGKPLTERARAETPQPAKPDSVINAIETLAATQGEFHRVSVGFPGVVRRGITETAVNLHSSWIGFDLATALSKSLNAPVRVINDADMQGLGAISGKGVELVVTLGTGFGSALFVDGKLVPNLEMGHHQFRKDETYEEQLGRATLDKVGEKKWNKRLEKAIASLEHLFNYDYLYIGGGEAEKVNIKLPDNVKIISNITGLLGGIALWRDEV
ncbi:ROK family protein [Aetokthonos hydrillicola Thurmond2011]|jgi:polyphosphate glucokinase|uniref:ROK family protein n=2 Tax=Aetokthonos TaxID=1550243 RepID=A0AAP5I7A0_9CYAN|nr:ROK family protein [Aetokthonos hydrillicola]MBO3458152.1 ROK family protein [Aetokthonos hydrillicola CCALA 1050]MBW4584372.1 ROK family protein [Aetokthonos hydrillicola CCALA 1050]MDR9896333.1 ROK family protein [Aetokthonos hydrillicola Thurmond2011]